MANKGAISNINPTVHYLTDPVGYDKAIQDVQILLADNLPWLQKSFGRAYDIRRDENMSLKPMAHMGAKKDLYPLMPNDSLKSYSFMFPLETAQAVDYEQFSQTNRFTRRTALVIWGNIKKVINKDSDYQLEGLNQEVVNVLKKNVGVVNLTNIGDDNISDIFNPYPINQTSKELYYPYFAFRYEFELNYSEGECGVTAIRTKPLKAYTIAELQTLLSQEQIDGLQV